MTSATEHRVRLEGTAATESWAGRLAECARPGDCITLSGELGAGKTVFARAFIRRLAGERTEVTSPTFTLMQSYDAALLGREPVTLWHLDLYRLRDARELDELGIEEALIFGIVLIEWPEIAGERLPQERLRLVLHAENEPDERLLVCNTSAQWYSRLHDAGLIP